MHIYHLNDLYEQLGSFPSEADDRRRYHVISEECVKRKIHGNIQVKNHFGGEQNDGDENRERIDETQNRIAAFVTFVALEDANHDQSHDDHNAEETETDDERPLKKRRWQCHFLKMQTMM